MALSDLISLPESMFVWLSDLISSRDSTFVALSDLLPPQEATFVAQGQTLFINLVICSCATSMTGNGKKEKRRKIQQRRLNKLLIYMA